MSAFSRADRSRLAEWWFTVDRALLGAFLLLIAIGIVVTPAASPAVAVKKGFEAYHFVERHLVFAGLSVVVMLTVSLLEPRALRRVALAVFAVSILAMFAVVVWGEEINGARRWVRVAGWSLQPSEFAKPAFAVIVAWAFAEFAEARRDVPALAIAVALYAIVAMLLVQQPDVGQTVLVSLIWGAMFIASGQPMVWAAILALAGAAGLAASYLAFGYIQQRVDRFVNPIPGNNSQGERALQSFAEGGFFGRGPGEGTIKSVLPDAHTDFVFAVIGEEYGVFACAGVLAVFAYVAIRPMIRSELSGDRFVKLAVVGLAVMMASQALINMGVNVGLLPPKGMTLPFISTGGSSMLAMGLAAGFMLALTRRRPRMQPGRQSAVSTTSDFGLVERSSP